MKYRKNIMGFEKSKSINYNTSVTATKGEQIAIWSVVIIYMVLILISLFIIQSLAITITILVVGMFVIMGLMIFFIFRPLHKEERLKNASITKATTDYSYNTITGKYKDNSQVEKIK